MGEASKSLAKVFPLSIKLTIFTSQVVVCSLASGTPVAIQLAPDLFQLPSEKKRTRVGNQMLSASFDFDSGKTTHLQSKKTNTQRLATLKGHKSKFTTVKGETFRNNLVFLPAYSLVMWYMRPPMNFVKIAVLKM